MTTHQHQHHHQHAAHSGCHRGAGDKQSVVAATGHDGPASAEPEALPAGTTYTCRCTPRSSVTAPGNCRSAHGTRAGHASLDDGENPELTDFRRRFWWTLPLSILVLVVAMFGHRLGGVSPTVRTWIELVLTTPVVLWAGWPFFQRWRNRSPVAAPTCGR